VLESSSGSVDVLLVELVEPVEPPELPELPELSEPPDVVVESAGIVAGPTPKLVAVLSAGPQDKAGSAASRTRVRIAESLMPARSICPRSQQP
jgi:hypothetical protein